MADGTVTIDIKADGGDKVVKSIQDIDRAATKLGTGKKGDISEGLDKTGASAGKAQGGFKGLMQSFTGLGSAGEKTGGVLGSFREKLSFGAIAGAAQSAVTGLIGGIGDLVKEAVGANDAIDKFKSTMQFAGFGKKEIANATADMKKYADDTVYDLNTVLNTSAQLGANGVKNFTGLTKAAGNLNAVAGGNADTFKSVAMVLTQTAGAGKLTTENWNQLTDAIPGASGVLQAALKKNGAYTGNFRDAMADGQITADEFNKAILELGNNPGAIKAATSTKTFEGAIGNMEAAAVSGIQKIIDGFNKLSTSLTGMSIPELIGKLGDGLGTVMSAIGDGIGNAASAMSPFSALIVNIRTQLSNLGKGDAFTGLLNAIKPIGGVFQALGTVVGSIANGVFVGLVGIVNRVGTAFSNVFGGSGGSQTKGFFTSLSSTISSFGDVATNVIGVVSGVIESLPWEAIFTAVKIAITGIMTVLSKIAGVISAAFHNDIVKAFGAAVLGAAVAIKGIVLAFTALNAVITIGKTVMMAFNAIMAINPFVLIIAAIAAVVAGLTYFFTQTKTGQGIWQGFVSFLAGAWNGLVGIASTVWTAVVNFFTMAATNVQTVWSGIGTFFQGLWNGIVTTVQTIVAGIQAAWNGVATFFSTLWAGIVTAATAAWNMITAGIMAVVGPFIPIFQNLWTGLATSLSTIWNGIVSVAQGVWEMVKSVIMGPILIVIDLLTGDWTQLGADLQTIWNSIVSAAQSIWNGLVQIFSGIWNVIKAAASAMWQGFTTMLSGLWNGAVNAAKSIWNALTGFFSGLWNGIKSAATSLWNGLVSGLKSLWSGAVNGAKSIWNALTGFFSGLWNGIKSTATSAWNGLKSTITSIATGIVNGVKGVWNGFKNIVSNVVSGIKSGFNALSHFSLADAGRAIMDSLLSGLKRAWKGVTDFVGGIGKWIRDHKGPINVDRRLLIPAGNAIMGGLNEGLTKSFQDVKNNVGGMNGQLAGLLSGSRFSTAEQLLGGHLGVVPSSQTINNYNTTNQTRSIVQQANSRPITVVSQIDGTEVARATVKPMDEQLGRRWDDQSRKMNK